MAAYTLATPNTGKANVKHTRVLLDEVDLSGYSRQFGSLGVTYDTNDITGYSDGVHTFQLGRANHILSGYQAVLDNTALLGSHIELSAREEYIASVCLGTTTPPEVGSRAWLTSMESISYDAQGGGSDAVLVSAELEKSITNTDHSNPWGIVLSDGTSRTVTVDLGSCDNLVASTNGLIANLHITASSGTTWTFDIEQSSDNDDAGDPFVSIGTFVLDGSVIGSEQLIVTAAAGAVERYLRAAIVREGVAGSVTAWITVARNINLDA